MRSIFSLDQDSIDSKSIRQFWEIVTQELKVEKLECHNVFVHVNGILSNPGVSLNHFVIPQSNNPSPIARQASQIKIARVKPTVKN